MNSRLPHPNTSSVSGPAKAAFGPPKAKAKPKLDIGNAIFKRLGGKSAPAPDFKSSAPPPPPPMPDAMGGGLPPIGGPALPPTDAATTLPPVAMPNPLGAEPTKADVSGMASPQDIALIKSAAAGDPVIAAIAKVLGV